MSDPREPVYDCNAEERDDLDPCGECIVCLETLLAERTRDLEAREKKIEEMRRIGGVMANACFNLSQPEVTLRPADREALKLAQVAWDEVRRG